MEYSNHQSGDNVEIKLTGRLTFDDQRTFREILKVLGDAACHRWVIDLTALEFIDSAGLGLLLRIRNAGETSNANTALRVSADGQVRDMMDIACFDQMFPYTN